MIAKDIALACLDLDGRARIIVDSELKLLWVNGAAADILAIDPAISIDDGQIRKGEAHDVLKRLLEAPSGEKPEAAIRFVGDEGYYLVRAIRIRERSEGEGFCLEIKAVHPNAKVEYFDFREPFGLTGMEAFVALRLLDGLPVAEIAQLRNISVETVRSHVRAIYEKMGMSSREKLFSILRQFQYV